MYKNKTCKYCKYYYKYNAIYFYCKRYPPIYNNNDECFSFPGINVDNDFGVCGEFKQPYIKKPSPRLNNSNTFRNSLKNNKKCKDN
jgi:hypothetical protein